MNRTESQVVPFLQVAVVLLLLVIFVYVDVLVLHRTMIMGAPIKREVYNHRVEEQHTHKQVCL